MAIAFACPGCGKRFKVDDDKAGRKGKCPGCNAAFQIPAAPPRRPDDDEGFEVVEEAPPPARAEARRRAPADDLDDRARDEDRPRRRRPVADEYAGDEEEEERPRRRRKKKRKSSTGLIIGLVSGAVGLLILLGVGVLLLFRLGGSSTVADDLKYLPDNSQVFVSVNMDKVTGSELYKRLREETGVLNNFDQQAIGDFAKELTDMERMTVAGTAEDNSFLVVLRYKKVVSLDNLAAKSKIKLNQEEEFGGYKVRHDGFQGVAVTERKTVVTGPVQILRQVLERKGAKASLSAGLQPAFNELDFTKPIAVAMDLQATAANQPGAGLPFALGPKPGAAPDSFTAHVDLGTNATVSVSIACKGAQEAEDLKKGIEKRLAMFKGPIPLPGMPREVVEALKNLQVTANDNKVLLSLSVDNNTVVEIAKKIPAVPRP